MANPNKLPVLEVFGPTIQGEGAMIGKQTTFIRAVHCDYACKMCDSMHAVDPAQYKGKETTYTAQELLDKVLEIQGDCRWVTLSGGNPALWDFSEFMDLAFKADLLVAVETQGSVFKPWLAQVDQLTVSPKGPGMGVDAEQSVKDFKAFIQNMEEMLIDPSYMTIKIPIFHAGDLDFAETIWALNPNADLYLSIGNDAIPGSGRKGEFMPLPSQRDRLLGAMDLIYDEVKKRPALANAIILPQLHVLLWGNRQLV